jgi:hypothetical protein
MGNRINPVYKEPKQTMCGEPEQTCVGNQSRHVWESRANHFFVGNYCRVDKYGELEKKFVRNRVNPVYKELQ